MDTILIIGAGQAGGRAAEALRTRGFDGKIVLIGEEQYRPYERPTLSKGVLTAEKNEECFSAWVHPSEFYAANRIDWIADRVEKLDVVERLALLESGRGIKFDKCLITTGGRARHLASVPLGPHVFTLRTLHDAMRVRERMRNARSVAVIGGGFLGLEFAASARARAIDVTVIESGDRLLKRALPTDFSDRLRVKHEQNGVKFVFGANLLGADEQHGGVKLTLANRDVIQSDFVVVAIGQEPNEELAKKSGLLTGDGIQVDSYCESSVPGIYAAGDCANFPFGIEEKRLRLESWQNAQEQAIAAAHNMLGDKTEYQPNPWFWTDQYDWNVQMLGMLDRPVDQWIERKTSDDKTLLMGLQGDVIVYALSVNSGGDLRAIRRLVEQSAPIAKTALADMNVKLRQLEREALS